MQRSSSPIAHFSKTFYQLFAKDQPGRCSGLPGPALTYNNLAGRQPEITGMAGPASHGSNVQKLRPSSGRRYAVKIDRHPFSACSHDSAMQCFCLHRAADCRELWRRRARRGKRPQESAPSCATEAQFGRANLIPTTGTERLLRSEQQIEAKSGRTAGNSYLTPQGAVSQDL